MRTIALTLVALCAFAANSLLCRLALLDGAIDPASFTSARLLSGAITLAVLLRFSRRDAAAEASWISAGLLALYAVPFAFAYHYLSTGTGALIAFGAVQSTMILGSYRAGKSLSLMQWGGLVVAFGGLIYLVAPGVQAPSPVGAALMIVAGAAWGLYSLRGRSAGSAALALTAGNFIRATPLALAVSAVTLGSMAVSPHGIALAIASGAIASGLGYVVWYEVLPDLAPSTASVVQLAVPPIAAVGGIVLLGEAVTLRLAIASVTVLGGIAITLRAGAKRA